MGFLSFTAKINKPFKIGDSIRNRAGIYFDYEEAVITNYASIVMVKNDVSIPDRPYVHIKNFSIFPNPSFNSQTIRNESGKIEKLRIYANNGQLMSELEFQAFEEKILDLGPWASGVYQLVTASGEIMRIVKL
jgi:hypothetical protein